VLELAASKAAHAPAFDHSGGYRKAQALGFVLRKADNASGYANVGVLPSADLKTQGYEPCPRRPYEASVWRGGKLVRTLALTLALARALALALALAQTLTPQPQS